MTTKTKRRKKLYKIVIAKGGEQVMSCKGRGEKTTVFYREAIKGEKIYVYNR